MATKTIKGVKYKLRGDTYANWSAKNPTLADREPAIVVVSAGDITAAGVKVAGVYFKFGDGSTAFNSLPFASAIAGDVKDWAKADTKPEYTAEEIDGLDEYISGQIEDTDTQYKIEQDQSNPHILRLYSKEKNGAESSWEVKATITTADTVYNDTDLQERMEDAESDIEALQELVGETGVAEQIAAAINALKLDEKYDTKGAAAEVLGSESDDAGDDTVYGANKAAAAAKAAADEKVATVTAADNSINVTNTDPKNPKIAVKVDPDEDNALEVTEAGMKVVIPDAEEVAVVKKATATTGYTATYIVTVGGEQVGEEINIPKDYLVKDASIKTVEDDDDPYSGAKVGDKYIDFVVNTVEGTGNESHIYLAVNEFFDVYTAGQGIDISDANVVAIKLDATNANGLALTNAGLKLNTVTASEEGEGGTNGAMLATDKEKLDGVAEGATKVEASDDNGKVKIDGVDTVVYTLPTTVLDEGDTFVFDGGDAEGKVE